MRCNLDLKLRRPYIGLNLRELNLLDATSLVLSKAGPGNRVVRLYAICWRLCMPNLWQQAFGPRFHKDTPLPVDTFRKAGLTSVKLPKKP